MDSLSFSPEAQSWASGTPGRSKYDRKKTGLHRARHRAPRADRQWLEPLESRTLLAATGLVAAYGFGEGTGTSVTDASGNGNTGTTSNTTWTTAGKFGNALQFNGTNSWVTVNDA